MCESMGHRPLQGRCPKRKKIERKIERKKEREIIETRLRDKGGNEKAKARDGD